MSAMVNDAEFDKYGMYPVKAKGTRFTVHTNNELERTTEIEWNWCCNNWMGPACSNLWTDTAVFPVFISVWPSAKKLAIEGDSGAATLKSVQGYEGGLKLNGRWKSISAGSGKIRLARAQEGAPLMVTNIFSKPPAPGCSWLSGFNVSLPTHAPFFARGGLHLRHCNEFALGMALMFGPSSKNWGQVSRLLNSGGHSAEALMGDVPKDEQNREKLIILSTVVCEDPITSP